MNSEQSQSFKERFKTWLSKLDPSRRKDVETLWERAGEADESRNLNLSDEEKRQAFSKIAAETGLQIDNNRQQTKIGPKKIDSWKWYVAAAVVILAAGLSYLTIPVQVSVPYGETASLILPDQSQLTLNSGTTITYSRLYGYLEREISLEGEAFFDVRKGEHPFTVHTSTATVKVLGTRFNLRSWQSDPGAETVVTLQEGSLALYAPGQPEKSVVLEPGESSKIRANIEKPTNPTKVNTERSLAWLENRFAFERRTVGEIIREIERRFDISVIVQPTVILSDTLTIYYNKDVAAEQIIRDISQSKGLNFREVNGGYVIESP